MDNINIIGIAIVGIFIMFILSKKRKSLSDYLLASTNLLMASILLADVFVRAELTTGIFIVHNIIPFLLFPTFFLYAISIINYKQSLQIKWLLIFLPSIFFTIFLLLDQLVLNNLNELELKQLFDYPTLAYHIFYKSNQVFFVVSLLWLLRKFKNYGNNIKNEFSFIDPIQLFWLKRFTAIYLILTLLTLLSFLLYNFELVKVDIEIVYLIINSSLVLSIFYLSFNGIKQYTIAEYYQKIDLHKQNLDVHDVIELKQKYKSSSLSKKDAQKLQAELTQLFEKEKIYCEPKLQIQEVAIKLNTTTHILSQIINSLENKPFFDFVNEYRVEHLKLLLVNPNQKKFTILALGYKSGFNSKASLNRIFKQFSGMTPREYQVNQNSD